MMNARPTVILLLTAALAFHAAFAIFGSPKANKKDDADSTCFCKLEGKIDDCFCDIHTVDYFNNMKIFPRLQSLLAKPYFKYFQYNANKECPFWKIDTANEKCRSTNCRVKNCEPDELPPGLAPAQEQHENEPPAHKYSEEAQKLDTCDNEEDLDSPVDGTISDAMRENLALWKSHDDSKERFCDVDGVGDNCPDCDFVDLTLNPERYTGYSGEAAHRIWRTIYEENCFRPPNDSKKAIAAAKSQKPDFSAAFLQDNLEGLCLEKRAFYRAISGLHSSITIHLCANYLMADKVVETPFSEPTEKWGPNIDEFESRFDPDKTNGQGPYWLRNLYFVYLLELRALAKAAPLLNMQSFYTGADEEDKDTQIAVKELLNIVRSFPDHFDESAMFNGGGENLKREFRDHFLNVSRVMDCVTCDKCRLWGKLQVTGLGTALKILFAEASSKAKKAAPSAEEMQRLTPPPSPEDEAVAALGDLRLSRNEIVALLNAFGRISTSIRQLEKFRSQS